MNKEEIRDVLIKEIRAIIPYPKKNGLFELSPKNLDIDRKASIESILKELQAEGILLINRYANPDAWSEVDGDERNYAINYLIEIKDKKYFSNYVVNTKYLNSKNLVIDYTADRRVLLNDTIILSKPDFDSNNDKVFSLLFKDPGKEFTIKEINDVVKSSSTDLNKIVEQLGFTGKLRQAFFSVSKNKIVFHNPARSI